MKLLNRIACFVMILSFSIGCDKEDDYPFSKPYPVIETNETAQVDQRGVTISANLLSRGNQEITDFGFMWEGKGIKYQYSLLGKTSLDDFKLYITSDLNKGTEYTYRAYAKTADLLLLGNEARFISNGTEAPEIHSFYPRTARRGDLISIRGKNFSVGEYRLDVLVGDNYGLLHKVSFDEIQLRVPTYLYKTGPVKIIVRSGNTFLEFNENITIQ